MDKSISSQPDAGKFRSVVVIILILTFMGLFLSYTDDLTEKAEIVAKDRVISEVRHSLAIMLYDYTIKGRQAELKKFNRENPFVPLGIYRQIPKNFHGSVPRVNSDSPDGWYFEMESKKLVYLNSSQKQGARTEWEMKYVMESGVGRLELIKLEK